MATVRGTELNPLKSGGEPTFRFTSPGPLLATIAHLSEMDHEDMLPDRVGRPVRLVERGEPIRAPFT